MKLVLILLQATLYYLNEFSILNVVVVKCRLPYIEWDKYVGICFLKVIVQQFLKGFEESKFKN